MYARASQFVFRVEILAEMHVFETCAKTRRHKRMIHENTNTCNHVPVSNLSRPLEEPNKCIGILLDSMKAWPKIHLILPIPPTSADGPVEPPDVSAEVCRPKPICPHGVLLTLFR